MAQGNCFLLQEASNSLTPFRIPEAKLGCCKELLHVVACSTRHHHARSMVLLLSHGTFQSRRHPQPWRRGRLWHFTSRLRQGLLRCLRQILPDVREGRADLPKPSWGSLVASPFGGCPHGPSWHIPGGLLGAGQEDLAEAVVREGEPLRAFVLALTPPWAARRMASRCCAQLDMIF